MSSRIEVGASNINAFLGAGLGTSDEIGVKVTGVNLGLLLFTSYDSDPSVTQAEATYALFASGSGEIVGVPDLTLSGTLSVKVNTTLSARTETITLPDSSDVVVFNFAAAFVQEVSGSVILKIQGFSLEGKFGFEQQPVTMWPNA